MSTLTDLLPQTTVVPLGGREFVVGQFTLNDVAYFQSRLEAKHPHPYALLRDRILAAEGELKEALLLKVQRDDFFYPPLYQGYATGEELLDFLHRLLNKHQTVSWEELVDLALVITREECRLLDSIAYNDTPRDELIRLLEGPSKKPVNPWERKDQWSEILDRIAQTYRWTYAQIGELTISQYHMACRAGKAQVVPTFSTKDQGQVNARLAREQRLLALAEIDPGSWDR